MEELRKENLVQGFWKDFKEFLRPIFYNGSSHTHQDQHRTKTYESIYSKTENKETVDI